MDNKTYKTNEAYILDVLEDEEERLLEELGKILPEETRHLFYKYLSVKDRIEKMKSKIA